MPIVADGGGLLCSRRLQAYNLKFFLQARPDQQQQSNRGHDADKVYPTVVTLASAERGRFQILGTRKQLNQAVLERVQHTFHQGPDFTDPTGPNVQTQSLYRLQTHRYQQQGLFGDGDHKQIQRNGRTIYRGIGQSVRPQRQRAVVVPNIVSSRRHENDDHDGNNNRHRGPKPNNGITLEKENSYFVPTRRRFGFCCCVLGGGGISYSYSRTNVPPPGGRTHHQDSNHGEQQK